MIGLRARRKFFVSHATFPNKGNGRGYGLERLMAARGHRFRPPARARGGGATGLMVPAVPLGLGMAFGGLFTMEWVRFFASRDSRTHLLALPISSQISKYGFLKNSSF